MTRNFRRWGTALAAAALLASTGTGTVAANNFVPELLEGPTNTSQPPRTHVKMKIHLPPNGGYVDWHNHPGFTSVTVEGDGVFSLMSLNCKVEEFTAGETFIPPRAMHTARNFSDEWVTGVATFVLRGHDTPPTTMADPERDARLDARCGLVD